MKRSVFPLRYPLRCISGISRIEIYRVIDSSRRERMIPLASEEEGIDAEARRIE